MFRYSFGTSIPLLSFTGLPHLKHTSADETSVFVPESQTEQSFRSSSPVAEGKWYSWDDKPPMFPVSPRTIDITNLY